jgi:ribosomal protein S18 acetylase RimI-like enzyme
MTTEIRLTRIHASERDALKEYVAALYTHDEDYDSMVNIEEGVQSLLRNEELATPFFIKQEEQRIGYVILTKYHSVEKGGLTLYIDELYVEEKHRRQGVGGAIMGKIIEIAQDARAKSLWAQVERSNLPAQSFFTTNGFVVDPHINFERPL